MPILAVGKGGCVGQDSAFRRTRAGVAGRPYPTFWRSQGPTGGTYGEGPSAPENPSLPMMPQQEGGRASGGPVDQHVGGRAFGWIAQVDASQILDLAAKPDGELVTGGGEVRERLLDVGSLEPHQHEAPHRSLLQSPSLPAKSRPSRLSLEPLAALPAKGWCRRFCALAPAIAVETYARTAQPAANLVVRSFIRL
jgi:hypothetical protein